MDKGKNIGEVENGNAQYFKLSTDALMQLRIAGITIAVALSGFLATNIDKRIIFKDTWAIYFAIAASSLAAIFGLAAWKAASMMFYNMAEGKLKSSAHDWKKKFDILSWLLLLISVLFSALYLFTQKCK